nr:copia protein [Tanacetum cinerariifolium]
MPELEDTAKIQRTGIFGNAYDEDDLDTNNYSYVDKNVGAEADFNNMEPSNVAIGTKWVYRNKKDERGIVVRNKARLVAQGNKQKEGIDYDDVFASVARVEAIRLFLAFASYMNFHVYQINVKSSFLYGTVGESSPNPTTSNPKRRNRRRSKHHFILEESPLDTMADQRTMAELLRAPTEGYTKAIVVPPILAEHFELKHSLINMMTSDQFFGLEKDNPHDHI